MNLSFYPDGPKILETWYRSSSFKHFRIIRIEKQICLFVFWENFLARQFSFKINWPLLGQKFIKFLRCFFLENWRHQQIILRLTDFWKPRPGNRNMQNVHFEPLHLSRHHLHLVWSLNLRKLGRKCLSVVGW